MSCRKCTHVCSILQDEFVRVLEPKVGAREYEDKEKALEVNKEILKRFLGESVCAVIAFVSSWIYISGP